MTRVLVLASLGDAVDKLRRDLPDDVTLEVVGVIPNPVPDGVIAVVGSLSDVWLAHLNGTVQEFKSARSEPPPKLVDKSLPLHRIKHKFTRPPKFLRKGER